LSELNATAANELLELAGTPSGGREYTKLQRPFSAGYVVRVDHPTVRPGRWPAEALAITEAEREALAGPSKWLIRQSLGQSKQGASGR